MSDETANVLRFSVAPEPSHLLRARERLRDYLRQYCPDRELVSDVVLCLEEACTNAIRHSGSSDDVLVTLRFEGSTLHGEVKDKGRGFDPSSFDPSAPPSPVQDGGRGLYLIARVMHELEFENHDGLRVRMAMHEVPRRGRDALAAGHDDPCADSPEQRRRALLDEMNEGYYELDWEYRYVYVNDAVTRSCGRSREQLLGRTPFEVFPQVAGSDVGSLIRDAMELGRAGLLEYCSPVSGDWIEARVYPATYGVSGYFREINDRKRVEREREELIERLRTVDDERRLLAEVVERSTMPFAAGEPDGRLVLFNQAFCDLTGYSRQELEAGSVDWSRQLTPGEWRRQETAALAAAVRRRESTRYEKEYVRKDGTRVPVEIFMQPVFGDDGELVHYRSFVSDISERRRLEIERDELLESLSAQTEELQTQAEELQTQNEELHVQREELESRTEDLRAQKAELTLRASLAAGLNRINGALHSTMDAERVTQLALEHGVEVLGLDAGCIESREDDGWRVIFQHGLAAEDVGRRLSFDEAPGAVRASVGREPFALDDVRADGSFNVGLMRTHGLRALIAVPLVAQDTVTGCMLFYSRAPRRFGDAELGFAEQLGATVSLAIENARLVARERETARLSSTLNEINNLIHASLDVDTVMRRIVEQAAVAVGSDSVAIAVRHGDDWVTEYEYPEPEVPARRGMTIDESPFVAEAIASRRPVAIDDCANDPLCVPDVQRMLGVLSVLCLPLIAGDEVLGVVFFNHHTEAVEFEPRTVDFARRLATAMSLALGNARLYAAQQRIATTLQESFVHPAPQVPGLKLGMVAHAAYEPELVGGDFTDAFETDDGRVLIMIGDVAGKGVRAAGLTETVRSTVRAFASLDPSPASILEKANTVLLRGEPTDPHVTAFIAVIDPETGHVTYASAGHPAAIHLGAGTGGPLGVTYGPPLHSFPSSYQQEYVRMALGDCLVLYTDGVTESRRDDEEFGEERLVSLARRLSGGDAQSIAEGIRDAAVDFSGGLKDDLLVVTVRLA